MNKKILLGILVILVVGSAFLYLNSRLGSNSETDLTKLESLPAEEKIYIQTLESGLATGNPFKDGIPAIDQPKYDNFNAADEWLEPSDIIFGVETDDGNYAYPQRILVWHEIVNESFAGESVSVTYCPLTGTAIGFKADENFKDPTFGTSGKLVNSNLVMYDRETDSYWPQIAGTSITGPTVGQRLEEFPVIWTTWEKWKAKHPDTLVLSRDTGFIRNYGTDGDPYGSYLDNSGYYQDESIIFQPLYKDNRLAPKDVVVGLRDNERNAVAIVKDVLRAEGVMEITLGQRQVQINYDEELDFYSASYLDNGEWLNAFDAMWFSWYAYYPETELISNAI